MSRLADASRASARTSESPRRYLRGVGQRAVAHLGCLPAGVVPYMRLRLWVMSQAALFNTGR